MWSNQPNKAMKIKETTSENLKAIREENGLNQDQIALMLGITQTAVSKIEGGTRTLSDSEKKLLDWYFFGSVPARITATQSDLSKVLDFDEAEWKIIGHIARRQGLTESEWIVQRIRDYLAFLDADAGNSSASLDLATLDNVPEAGKIVTFELPFLGYAAAGSPVISQLTGETSHVPKKYPAGYFVVAINGQSMEPTLPDGSRIVCEPREYTPKHGKICIISDGHGSSVKRYDGKRKAFVSDNPDFPDFTPVDEVKLQGYFVEILPED